MTHVLMMSCSSRIEEEKGTNRQRDSVGKGLEVGAARCFQEDSLGSA